MLFASGEGHRFILNIAEIISNNIAEIISNNTSFCKCEQTLAVSTIQYIQCITKPETFGCKQLSV